jgi:hypothetical protein
MDAIQLNQKLDDLGVVIQKVIDISNQKDNTIADQARQITDLQGQLANAGVSSSDADAIGVRIDKDAADLTTIVH